MTNLHELSQLGQAVWLDFIRRSFISSGELQGLLDAGVRGITSNPTIFEKAIAGSNDYDSEMEQLVAEGRSVDEIYEALAINDIAQAADMLRPLYDSTGGTDGFVSLEVSPTLAHDTFGTIADAKRLFATLHRPNIMIKIPGTRDYRKFIRALTGILARKLGKNIWKMLPFTRVASWGKDFLNLKKYFHQNREEAAGRRPYRARKNWYKYAVPPE